MLRSNLGYYRVSTRYIYLRARLCSNKSKKNETRDENDMSSKRDETNDGNDSYPIIRKECGNNQ